MKVIIAGGRDFNDWVRLDYHCTELYEHGNPHERRTWNLVLCGMAPGADKLGHNWAVDNSIGVLERPADWAKHGKSAGPIRNEQMANEAHMLIAFWDGKSPGTKDMILRAVAHGLEIHVFKY